MKKLSAILLTAFAAATFQMSAADSCPRPEYPRPQFERNQWVNLNGDWTYVFDFVGTGFDRNYPASKGFDNHITVPFSPESKLGGVEYTDYINNIWYHRPITMPAEWAGKRVKLNFGAVYNDSQVFIDGKLVGRHFGGSPSFSFDITEFVKDGKAHDLVVLASSDVRTAKQGAGKQAMQYPSNGCNYTRTTGIWQTVWMEPVDEEALVRTYVTPDIDQQQLVIRPEFAAENGGKFTATLLDGNKVVATKTVPASNAATVVLPVKKMKLWTPEEPFLYTLNYTVTDKDGNVVDEVSSYAGMRKVSVEGNKVFLNNEPCYLRLVLDQGYYPESQWTAPSDEALRHDIELGKEAGFNGARLHQKVFEERYHYWADKLGYLTWGEFPSWGADMNTTDAARNFLTEWSECVTRDRNHPSIIAWTPMNEEWWPDDVQYPRLCADVYKLTKTLDPSRPVNLVSGGVGTLDTDLWTMHNYEQNPEKLKEIILDNGKMFLQKPYDYNNTMNIGWNMFQKHNNVKWPEYNGKMPYIMDEFGGIKWGIDQANQSTNDQLQSWGYGQAPVSLEEFYSRLEGMVDTLMELSDTVCGYCYTQITDVEQEQNGVYWYDRKPKFDMKVINRIFSKDPYQKSKKK